MNSDISLWTRDAGEPPPRCGQRLLPTLIDEIARRDPERPFTVIPKTSDPSDGFEKLNFQRFASAVDKCSYWLEKNLHSVHTGQAIAYIGSLDLMYHIATLAAVKTGHTLFLPSHRNSLTAHTHLLDEIDCNASLVQASLPSGLNNIFGERPMQTIIVPGLDFFLQSDGCARYPYSDSFDEVRYRPLVILQTSGTTGLPQLVKVNHGTLASMDANQLIPPLTGRPIFGSLLSGTRILMAFPLYHMASFTLLLGLAVYYGVVIVLPPANEPLTARLVESMCIGARIDGCALPPSILVDLYHEKRSVSTLQDLKYIFYAGGPLPQEVGNKISSMTYLASLFGSTETALPPHEVCQSEDWDYVSYSPFYGSSFRPVQEEGLYEHLIVRRRELDLFQSVFSTYTQVDEFNTMDLYRKHPVKPGLWKFCGRSDDLIVLSNAEKFNPIDFESSVSSHPAIRTALVGGHGRFQTCLLIESMSPCQTRDDEVKLLEDIWPSILEANHHCPSHARVMKDFITFTNEVKGVERAGKGTVQRHTTLNLYRDEINELYEVPALPNMSPKDLVGATVQSSKDMRDALTKIVSGCAWLTGDLTPNADLFELGLDSLQAVSLSKHINAYLLEAKPNSRMVDSRAIYAHPSIEKLLSMLEGMIDSSMDDSCQHQMQAAFDEWSSYLPQAKSASLKLHHGLVVLMTGSTGFVGSYLLDVLLSCPKVVEVYCLIRSDQGLLVQMESSKSKGLTHDFRKVKFLQYDSSYPKLGLSEEIYQACLEKVTHVVHNAWDVNFNRPFEAFISPHISGVRYLIDFCIASASGAHLLFVSTTSTTIGNPETSNETASESVPLDWSSAQSTGYAQSKLVAERLIDTAARASDLRSSICRLGQISGPTSEQGCWNQKEWLPGLITSSIHLGRLPRSLASMDVIDWIPVNLCAQIIVELLLSSTGQLAIKEHEPHTSGSPELDSDCFIEQNSNNGQNIVPDLGSAHSKALPSEQTVHSDQDETSPYTANNRTRAQSPGRTFNILNPHKTTWQALIPSIQASCPTPIKVISLPEWISTLHTEAENESEAAKLPAIRIQDFFHRLGKEERSGARKELDISEALKYSKTMTSLAPVDDSLMRSWMRQWGYLD